MEQCNIRQTSEWKRKWTRFVDLANEQEEHHYEDDDGSQ